MWLRLNSFPDSIFHLVWDPHNFVIALLAKERGVCGGRESRDTAPWRRPGVERVKSGGGSVLLTAPGSVSVTWPGFHLPYWAGTIRPLVP